MQITKRILLAPALLFIMGQVATLNAGPLLWTMSGATFNDGGTLTGSFVYDADGPGIFSQGDSFTQASFTTTSGSVSAGQHYAAPLGLFAGNNLYFYDYFSGNQDESIGIFLASRPTDAGGTIAVTYAFERRDDNTSGQQNLYFVYTTGTGGTITASSAGTSSGSSGAPEPSSWLLLATGVLVSAFVRRQAAHRGLQRH